MPGEFALIERYFAKPTPSAILGPGDDCALLPAPAAGHELAITTDMLVAGTHFYADTDPEGLGWKCLAVNVSDLAAMGARPRYAQIAASLPNVDEAWIAAFAQGFFACAKRYGVEITGGDTTQGALNFCITAIGDVPAGQALRRSGAQVGDDIWVSGRPGLAALGLAHLQGRVSLSPLWQKLCLAALHKPQARVALGLALRGIATAAIDVSDGLLADLGHILRRSGLAGEVQWAQLPHLPPDVPYALAFDCQLAGGDDYELCFTAPFAARLSLARLATEIDLPLWRIGQCVAAVSPEEIGQAKVLDANGEIIPYSKTGYQHFASP